MSHVFHNKAAVRALIRYGKVFCLIGTIIPLINLVLRIYDPKILEKIIAAGIVVINPLSSILFFLLGISLWFVRSEKTKGINRTISICLVAVVLAVTLLKAIGFIVDWNFSIDTFLFGDYARIRYGEGSDSLWSQHFPYILISFILVSLSILFIDTTHSHLVSYSQLLSYVMILLALVNVYGYVFQIEILYGQSGEALPMSLLAAITSFFLSAAVLFLRPYKGSMRLLIGANPTKVILIRFFALLAPLILGWFETIGERRGYYSQEFGKAILTTFSFALTMALLAVKAEIQYTYRVHKTRVLHHIKRERKRLRRILKHSPTYINIVDVEKDKLIYSNVDTEKLLNGQRESVSEGFMKKLEDAAAPDDRKKLQEARRKIETMGVNDYEEIEYRIIDSENNTHWLFSRRIAFKIAKGKVRQILMNTVDVSKQKEQVEQVKRQERTIEHFNIQLRDTKKELEKANHKLKSKVETQTIREDFCDAYISNSFVPIAGIEFGEIESIDVVNNSKEYISDKILSYSVIGEVNNSFLKMFSLDKSERLKNIKLNQFWQASYIEKKQVLYSLIEHDFQIRAVRLNLGFSRDSSLDLSVALTGIDQEGKKNGFWITVNSL